MGILAFFVLLFTVRVRITIELKDELYLTVMAFGIKLKILPKKPKKYKLGKYTLKKIAKRDRIAAEKAEKAAQKKAEKEKKKAADKQKKKDEQAKLTKAERKAIKARKRASRPPIPDMLSLFLSILKMFFSGLFGKFHFHVARIRIGIGSSDAATTALLWCAVSAAIKPVLMFLDKHSNLHGMKNADIKITTDYLSEEIKTDIKLGFSTSLGGILGVVFRAGFKFIFGWFKIKPTPPKDSLPAPSPDKDKKEENKSSSTDGQASPALPESLPQGKKSNKKSKK